MYTTFSWSLMSFGMRLSLMAQELVFALMSVHGLEFKLCNAKVFFMEKLELIDGFVKCESFGMNL